MEILIRGRAQAIRGENYHRCFLKTIFILRNLRGSSPLLWPWWFSSSKIIFQPLAGAIMKMTWKLSSVDSWWLHSQAHAQKNRKQALLLKMVKHTDNSVNRYLLSITKPAYVLLIFTSHLLVFFCSFIFVHTNHRSNLRPLHWKHGGLATEPPGTSSHLFGFTMTKYLYSLPSAPSSGPQKLPQS